MSSTFDKRKKSFESKFAHDEEKKFRIAARARKMLALWAAGKIDIKEDKIEDYVDNIVTKGVESIDADKCVYEIIMEDFEKAGLEISENDLANEYARFLDEAERQVEGTA